MKFDGMATSAFEITPSDTTTFGIDPKMPNAGLYIGTGGDVAVTMAGTGEEIVFTNVVSGTFLPILVSQVLSTGTDASDILGLYSY